MNQYVPDPAPRRGHVRRSAFQDVAIINQLMLAREAADKGWFEQSEAHLAWANELIANADITALFRRAHRIEGWLEAEKNSPDREKLARWRERVAHLRLAGEQAARIAETLRGTVVIRTSQRPRSGQEERNDNGP